jgi:hypothetical protein
MSRQDPQNNVNQDGKREHEHPHGESLPHDSQRSTHPRTRDHEKRDGKMGQPNFIPGEAPVGEPGRTKPSKTRRK